MYYQQVQPHPSLAQFVQCYWVISADARALPTHAHGVVPGGYVDIVFNVGDHVYLSGSGNIFFDKAKSFVAGPFDRFLGLRAEGQLSSLGVRFQLGKNPFFFDLSLRAIRNQAIPLAAVWADQIIRAEVQNLESRLAQLSATAERLACVEQFLLKFIQRWPKPNAIVAQAVGLIEAAQGRVSVEALASALRLSVRQLERKFTQHIGLSPKTFCRVTRFHLAKSLLESRREPSGCDLAYACGYYDQTHLIQEFRLFTGQTPAGYAKAQPVGFFLYDNQPSC